MVSLLKVLELHAKDFCQSMSLIGQFYAAIQGRRKVIGLKELEQIAPEIEFLIQHCKNLGLNTTLVQLERVKTMVVDGSAFEPRMHEFFVSSIFEIGTRLRDELESRKCYIVSAERTSFITGNNFSRVVGERFSEAIPDMDEAARCFAFERPTACIFHLMRITEFAIHEIASLLKIQDHAPSWETIIRKIDDELKSDYKVRKYKGDQDLLANTSTHVHAVKVAWRNKTMHVEKINTMEHAKEIYDATTGLMRYLAENLPPREIGTV